jgi:protein phosphatase 2C family protein 2/3
MLDRSGSCAVVALIVEQRVFVVNVGDSRAFLSADGGNFCLSLSNDHKPDEVDEHRRIVQNGGKVYQTKTLNRGPNLPPVTLTYQPG